MVIRRIREHVAAQNWFAVGIDLLIVVLGVIIATQVNNWNEARLERDKAQSYRARLVEDLRDNEREFRDKQIYFRAVLGHATAALDAFDRSASELDEAFLVDASLATNTYAKRPKRFTYDALVAAGDLELLGALGYRIGTYYALLDNLVSTAGAIPPYRERLLREIPYDVQKPIRQRCSDVLIQDAQGFLSRILPARCSIELDRTKVERGVARLRAAPELDRDLSRHTFFLDQNLGFLKAAERRARELRVLIERAED